MKKDHLAPALWRGIPMLLVIFLMLLAEPSRNILIGSIFGLFAVYVWNLYDHYKQLDTMINAVSVTANILIERAEEEKKRVKMIQELNATIDTLYEKNQELQKVIDHLKID